MNKLLKFSVAGLLLTSAIQAFPSEQPKVTYVGGDRYVCSGRSYECAQIDANNRAQEEREQRRYENQRRSADDYVRESRRRENDNRRRDRDRDE